MSRTPAFARLAAVLAAIVLVAGCAAGLPVGPQYAPRPIDAPVEADPDQAAALISAFRAEYGLPPVTADPALNAVAGEQANAMARADRMSHTLIGEVGTRVSRAGYAWRGVAENIAAGQGSLAAVMEAWETSPGHRANLLLPEVTEIGVASGFNPDSLLRAYWALVLATPR